jgi:hypothetical protein
MKILSFEKMVEIEGGVLPTFPPDTGCVIEASMAVASNFSPSEYGSAEAHIIYSLAYNFCIERMLES